MRVLIACMSKAERQTLRSRTFDGMANAFADQWGAT